MFSLSLVAHPLQRPVVLPEFDPEMDDVRSILAFLCSSLAADERNSISLSGLGVSCKLDVETDLLTLLEALPSAIQAIASGRSFDVDLYEQGVELSLAFTANGPDTYLVGSRPLAVRSGQELSEVCERSYLLVLFQDLRKTFLNVIRVSFPTLLVHPWLQAWVRETDVVISSANGS